jgi:cellulose synthase/poly-beta-1,6-N-acetylglucosamine synthase-like glycosyltransferase
MIPCAVFAFLPVFWEGFIQWLSKLTPLDFVLFFWPLIIFDLVRSIGKPIFLAFHALYKQLCPSKSGLVLMPKVSIIIPAHNEEEIIVKSIESALEADYPNKEIIVVDDGSTDRTYQLASLYASKGLIKLLHRDQASGSKAGALNFGICFASGEVLVTLDADTLIEHGSIKEMIKAFSDPQVSAVSGNVRILNNVKGKRNLLVRLQAYEYLIAFELGRRFSSITGTLLIISGAFGAFRKASIKTLGEYDRDTLTEDFDITVKLRKLGQKLKFVSNGVSWTNAPKTWNEWNHQRIRWTRGQAETIWKHRNLLHKKGFDFRSVFSIYDMLFSDIIILFLRFVWVFSLIFFFPANLPYVILLSLILYLILEVVTFISAGILSSRKSDLKNVWLAPLAVFIYRPYYSLVRFKAYIDWLIKKESSW